MVLMVVILFFLPLPLRVVVAVLAHNLRQVQVAVQAVVAVKNLLHLEEDQELQDKEIMADIVLQQIIIMPLVAVVLVQSEEM